MLNTRWTQVTSALQHYPKAQRRSRSALPLISALDWVLGDQRNSPAALHSGKDPETG
jgi:hypothetical protein